MSAQDVPGARRERREEAHRRLPLRRRLRRSRHPRQDRQRGGLAQHQRLIQALAAHKKRASVIAEGDFHAAATANITRSAELALEQPGHTILPCPLDTGDLGFPSACGGAESRPSALLDREKAMKPVERNGFTFIDVTADRMTFSIYACRQPQSIEEIDTMRPAVVYTIPRRV